MLHLISEGTREKIFFPSHKMVPDITVFVCFLLTLVFSGNGCNQQTAWALESDLNEIPATS